MKDRDLGSRMRPLSDPGMRGRALPFAAVAVIAVALALVPPAFSSDTSQLRTASFALAGLLAAGALIPWKRLPHWCQAVIPLGFFLVVALLRHGGGGAVSGFAALVLLPILWMALYGSRAELGMAIAGAAGDLLGIGAAVVEVDLAVVGHGHRSAGVARPTAAMARTVRRGG